MRVMCPRGVETPFGFIPTYISHLIKVSSTRHHILARKTTHSRSRRQKSLHPWGGVDVASTSWEMYVGIPRRVGLGRIHPIIPSLSPSANVQIHMTTSQPTGQPLAQGGPTRSQSTRWIFSILRQTMLPVMLLVGIRIRNIPLEPKNTSLTHPNASSSPENFEAAEKSSLCMV